jgi:hypothetical protein
LYTCTCSDGSRTQSSKPTTVCQINTDELFQLALKNDDDYNDDDDDDDDDDNNNNNKNKINELNIY